MPNSDSLAPRTDIDLPHSIGAALWRGARGCCPRCGEAKIFRKWLKPHNRCAACGLDLSVQSADDFPAYISIFITGHLLAPVLIMLGGDFELSAIAVVAIIIPLAIAMLVALLQPSKGAVIALQWWHGMHGFRRERLSGTEDNGA